MRPLYEPTSGWQKKIRSRCDEARELARLNNLLHSQRLSMREVQSTMRKHLRSWLVTLLIIALGLVLIPAAFLYFRQHAMIYYPRSYPPGFERALPPGTVQLEYTTIAGKQVAFYLPPRSGAKLPARVWLTFSGNASVALDWLEFVAANPNKSDGFLLMDYPGYGRSQGVAAIATTRGSADKAVATLAERLEIPEAELSSRLCVIGLSLGAAAALEFSAGHPIQCAVLIAPFTSMREMAAELFSRPASYLLLENYDNRARLRELAGRELPPRVAIFHGAADTLVPPRMSRELAESAPQVAEFFPVEQANHDTIVGDAMTEIIAWMNH